MTYRTDDISIHAKKYHRVILEGVNEDVESPESFAVKLASRMHVSLPRVKALISRLPCTVKSHLTATQANRLKDLLEEFGGRVRVEAHLVTPTGSGAEAEPRATASRQACGGAAITSCPDCGCEVEKGATFCTLCLRKFRDPTLKRGTLEERIPEKNPLDPDWDPCAKRGRNPLRVISAYVLLVVLGAVAAIAVFVLAK